MGALEGQKRRRKSKNKKSFLLTALIEKSLLFIQKIITFILAYPKGIFKLIILGILLYFSHQGYTSLKIQTEKIIPQHIEIYTSSFPQKKEVLELTEKIRLKHHQLSSFLDELEKELLKIPTLKQFAFRAELTGTLRIYIQEEQEAWALTFGKKQLIISDTYKIIGNQTDKILPQIEIPQNIFEKMEKRKGMSANYAGFNAPWFFKNVHIFWTALQKESLLKTSKVFWTKEKGFEIAYQNENLNLKLIIGKEDFEKRISQIPPLLKKTIEEDLKPQTLDVSLGEKAIMKF